MKRIISIFTLIFVLAFSSVCMLPILNVNAGVSSNTILSGTHFSDNTLSTAAFVKLSGSDVKAENGKIVFGSDDTNTVTAAQLTVKSGIFAVDYTTKLAEMDAVINFEDLKQGSDFLFAFALDERNSSFGEVGSLETVFHKDGGNYYISVLKVKGQNENEYFIKNSPITLKANNKAELKVSLYTNNKIYVSVNGTVCADNIDIGFLPEGFFAFGFRNAKSLVRIEDVELKSYYYSNPENVNVVGDLTEQFNNGEYNANLWYSESAVSAIAPCYLHVEEGVLRFNNTGYAHFTSRYKYSNFQLDFDLLDVAYPQFNDKGVLTVPASDTFEIHFGTESATTSPAISCKGFRLRFGGIFGTRDYSVVSNELMVTNYNTILKRTVMPATCNPFDGALTNGRRTNIRVVVEDMILKVWMKYEDSEWNLDTNGNITDAPVLEYEFISTPLGCVRFATMGLKTMNVDLKGTGVGNLSIDNVSLKNLDNEDAKRVIQGIAFKSNIYDLGDDYEYTNSDDPDDILANRLKSENGSGCNSKIDGSQIVLLCVLLGVVVTGVRKYEKNK